MALANLWDRVVEMAMQMRTVVRTYPMLPAA